jgi:hypothetical protein
MSARTHSDARRVRGLLLAFVLVVSQASAWFHAVAIAHVACPEHGEAMHGGALPAESAAPVDVGQIAPRGDGAVRADVATAAGHDHCANAALLRWRDVALTAPAALAPLALAPRPFAYAPSQDGARPAVLYLIAPKTSPPSRSV